MKLICISSHPRFTRGRVYEAHPDTEYVYVVATNNINIIPYSITDDKGCCDVYNLAEHSGIWLHFEVLQEHRDRKLNSIGI